MKITLYVDAKSLDFFATHDLQEVRGYTTKEFDCEVSVEVDTALYRLRHGQENSLAKIAREDKTFTRTFLTISRK